MEKQRLNRRTALLWADLVLVVVCLFSTSYIRQEMADGLLFGGYFILFLLAILKLYLMALFGSLLLLPLAIFSRKIRFAVIAAVLQIPASIPWLWLACLIGHLSWFEILMIAGIAVRVVVLISLAAARSSGSGPR